MEALLALGSNVDPETNMPRALRVLEGLAPTQARSRLWRTPPHGPVQGGPFVNVVLQVRWHGDLDQLRHALKRLERSLGRKPDSTWKARCIDIDICAVREGSRKGWTLIDTQLAEKPFLLRPLAEVAPSLSFGNRTAGDMAKAVPPEGAQVIELRTR